MRLATGGALLSHAAMAWVNADDGWVTVCAAAQCIGAIGLFAGFMTPLSSAYIAGVALWRTFLHSDDQHVQALLTALSVSLALLGPGALSLDAWLFGWRRIDVVSKGAEQRGE